MNEDPQIFTDEDLQIFTDEERERLTWEAMQDKPLTITDECIARARAEWRRQMEQILQAQLTLGAGK